MRLVILNEELTVVTDFGAFTTEQAETFFHDALSALEYRRQVSELMVRNEVQMRLLTDTLATMGLLHGNADALQQWMRPYITEEVLRLQERQNLFQRAASKLDSYREKGWDWLKSQLMSGLSHLLSKILKRLSR